MKIFPVFLVILLLGLPCWGCFESSDDEPGHGDSETDSLDDETPTAADEDNPEDAESDEETILCDAQSYDPGAFFGILDDLTSASRRKFMPFYSWYVLDFVYDSDADALDITSYWINKLPICACGLHRPDDSLDVPGDPEVLEYVEANGIGQGSGFLTVRLDLATGASHAVARDLGAENADLPTLPGSGGQRFDIEVQRAGGSVTFLLEAAGGYDLRGCPTGNNQQTKTILNVLRDGPWGTDLSICGEDSEGSTDCSLPEPTETLETISTKTPGAYLCDSEGCTLQE